MLVLLGLNHRSAPVAFRERMAFKESELPEFLKRLHEHGRHAEGVIHRAPALANAF